MVYSLHRVANVSICIKATQKLKLTTRQKPGHQKETMKLSKLAFASVIAAGVMNLFVGQALATEVSQTQKQELEVVCEVGAYGQATNCRAKGTQEQSQKVVYINGRAVRTHKVVNTALDARTVLFASVVVLAMVAALALTAKTR